MKKKKIEKAFLPVSKDEMVERGWYYYDFLVVTADAYIDHPSFGTAIIARVLEHEGYRVAVLAQPDWHSADAFRAMGRPRYGVMIGGGNIDSMVAHYTAAKKRRTQDLYSPGSRMGLRPDRPTIVYANRCREAFGDVPIVVGGLEASLRRFAHYDYWDDKVRRALIFDAQADLLVYGMGEYATREIARRLSKGEKADTLTDIRGTAFVTRTPEVCAFDHVECPSYEEVCGDKHAYALATKLEYEEHDPIRGKALWQAHGRDTLVVNPPAMPLSREELDEVAELPYMREVHPMYDALGGVAAIEEVRFSVAHNRGCFGGCNFCSLAFHQGRMITSRSIESCVREVEGFTHDPKFKGYVHDVGGPSANFRHPSCKDQLKRGMCRNKNCLAPYPCKNLDPDHSEYVELLRRLRAIPGVKKVFVRSGIRYDYLLEDKGSPFLSELVKYHISGQLKVAPEHCVAGVLDYMGKPHFDVFEKFSGSEASAHRLSERCFVISTAVAGARIVIPLARLRHVNVLALRLVGNRRRLRLIVPCDDAAQRFRNEARRNHCPVSDDLRRHIQCVRHTVDVGGRIVDLDSHNRVVQRTSRRSSVIVPRDLRAQILKNRPHGHKRAAAHQLRRHIGLHQLCVDIQLDCVDRQAEQ